MRTRLRLFAFLAIAALVTAFARVASTAGPRFYADDPLLREPASQDASKAERSEIGDLYEMAYNLFVNPKYKPTGLRAKNVNTVDEVPDSSWFTNRIGTRTLTVDQVVRGPIVGEPPDPSRWTIVREKTAGAHLLPRGRHGGGGDGDEVLLGARVQSGRIVFDDIRSGAC
jgi:hypothetical protein